ncbi:MAG: DmsE family decaheme c-type cytochrome [Gammaproteobacteria bacterium]|nr:DmsE family decaheme c-type cytochrome [Gammaproteobacteria bacterium]
MTAFLRARFELVLAAALTLLPVLGVPVWAQPKDVVLSDVVLSGDAACMLCHQHLEAKFPILGIGKTKHGTRADKRTPTCTSCHGASETHINPQGLSERPKPDRMFGNRSATPAPEQDQACLSCHQGGKRIHWLGSTHAARDVSCTSCHQIHSGHDKVRDKRTQPEVCLGCHRDVRIQIKRPSRHPILEGKVACSDCHNPHGSAGELLMVRDTINDTCYQCHMEKRGPFVYNHQPVTEDCSICHNPHGTINYAMLKLRSPFLCQQCHEPGPPFLRHPGLAASFDPSPFGFGENTLARGCLNCHTNIHGSNNPSTAGSGRTFQR